MNVRTKRLAILVGAAAVAVTSMSVSAIAAPAHGTTANPNSPSYQHPYRHGAIPTLQTNAKMAQWNSKHAAVTPNATSSNTLYYGGGVDGIGVQSGQSKVYLVFYGTQWGSATTTSGITSFSGDPSGGAPVAQKLFKGVGTGETWSNVLQQYCDGAVSTGASVCPSGSTHIPAQTAGRLAGVWYDNAGASPSAASGHQLGTEAVKAAAHFGNTSAASNRYSYYVILSPHNTNPDNYQGQYCAWHDYNGDTTLTGGAVASSYGDIAFSNQPYNIDSGSGCGAGLVNSPGALDGWTMSIGHEWSEMMTDQNPAGGWLARSGYENADECAYKTSGTGHVANVTFSTGTFALQGSWSNATNACRLT